ncbi:MAG: ribonuclease H [Bacteroidetes bacterium HGW-Bacteroidetes-22]|nr:MAG: ribonuclease H [Bacteroidetes bacterium HGW-Bacteroidetes-22]
MVKKKYYVVWEGIRPGIYDSWEACRRQVDGIEGARYKSFDTFEQATKAMMSDYRNYIGKNAVNAKPKVIFQFNTPGQPVAPALCVDAACSGNPGDMEYRCVHIPSGQEIFRQGPYKMATNNIGEYLALVHALSLQHQQGIDLPVYTDSVNAMKWITAGKARTKLIPTHQNRPVFDLLERAERWLMSHQSGIQILKWNTEAWGEIPADFGRK